MTTKVVDFLKESGGSNFTDLAPRPPTYGEENELQSNGGNSTKSGSSHKSHVSSKSHSSSRSGTSTKGGDHSHSPATTPRKSNLEGVSIASAPLETMTGHVNVSLAEDCEAAAPLGFEPEGSAANSPPYSENATPPHQKWAEKLSFLLNDSEGVNLFREFLENELAVGTEELDFWYACQGFKIRKDNPEDSLDRVTTDVQKIIYKHYVRNDSKVKCISKDVRKVIADKVLKCTLDPCIFDAAQEEVENYMRTETYPAFLRSQSYVQYVQNYVDSPKSSPSSGSNSARPVSQSGMLPVVHEDRELESLDLNSSALLPIKSSLVVKRTEPVLQERHTEAIFRPSLYRCRSPPYPGHVSYAPVSAQDSELQSLSSDALTDDTVSVTDSSVDGRSRCLPKKNHRMKTLASQNKELRTGLNLIQIPRTQHAPKDRNVAETDPRKFSALVIDKLNMLLRERESAARMEEKLKSINFMEVDRPEGSELLQVSCVRANTSASFIAIPSTNEEENAESILDQHCQRIWKSSTQHTPSHSPPGALSPPHSRSPDRHKDSRKKFAALPVSASTAYNARGYHKKRDFVPCDIGDRNLILCGTETHRHIHHHHHHHHSSRDSSSKKLEVEGQTSVVAWRTEAGGQNPITDFTNLDYANRGRTSSRKVDSNFMRRSSAESSCNVDSGVSLESVKMQPNWIDPTSEKVIKWIMDSETVHEVSTSVQETDKSSSHKRSHRLNQLAGSAQQSRPSSRSKTYTRSASIERSSGMQSTWSGAVTAMPGQPFAQDPCMPLPTPPNPTTQLEEAKRRLLNQSRTAGDSATPMKPRNGANMSPKDKTRSTPGGSHVPATSSSSHIRTFHPPPATAAGSFMPAHVVDTPNIGQILDSRPSQRSVNCQSTSLQHCPTDTVIGIYMGQEPIPYRHQLPGRSITLAQIKTLVTTKRGPFKYYFKRHSDEFGDSAGAVFEEISDDDAVVPMWQGKIVVKVEKLDL